MAHPVLLQTASLRQCVQMARDVFSRPQWKYFVTVLLGLMKCGDTRTLSGPLRQVAVRGTLSGMSRFLQRAPWSVEAVTGQRQAHFNAVVADEVAQAHAQQRAQQPRKRGRRRPTVVTGYLIFDDSTCVQPYSNPSLHSQRHCRIPLPAHTTTKQIIETIGEDWRNSR